MNKIVGLDIGENSVKMAYFVGRELKRTAKLELPDAMVSGGRILSMDAMADFLHDAAKGSGIPLTNAALVVPASEVYTRVITLPAMTEQQLFYNLPYEFRDFLTEEKSKYFFDYAVRRIVNDEWASEGNGALRLRHPQDHGGGLPRDAAPRGFPPARAHRHRVRLRRGTGRIPQAHGRGERR